MENIELVEIEGSVEEIIFKNEDTGFCVLELNTGEELLAVVGLLASANAGDDLRITGYHTNHPAYGRQFKAEVFERSFPKTADAIYKYLASGVIKGIGPVLARDIVGTFAEDTFNIIETAPNRLSEVKGISPRKAEKLSTEFKKVFSARTVMLFLEQHGITCAHSVLVWKKWGEKSVDYIKDNPYILCTDDIMVPFSAADEIAYKMEFSIKDISRIKAGLCHVLRFNTNNGFTALPKDQLLKLTEKLLGVDKTDIQTALDICISEFLLYNIKKEVQNKEFIMLPVFYLAETYIANRLKSMLKQNEVYENLDTLIDLTQTETGIVFEEKQRQAIINSQKYDVMILTGGPGTGKTTVLNGILSLFEHQGMIVDIAAPTGRASKRISEVTGRESKTIHRLLGAGFEKGVFQKHEGDPLKSDVVIIDETSMLDTELFANLLRAIKPEAKLILVGDHNQLPSVGPGNILHDLIQSEIIPVTELTEIFRQSSQSLIVLNAHKIISGKMPELSIKDNDFFFIERNNNESAANTIIQLVSERLPATYDFDPVEDIQVLTPSRKGNLGVIDLNNKLQSVLNPVLKHKNKKGDKTVRFGDYTFRENDKVMQNCNNYDIEWEKDNESGSGVFNGDIGIIQKIDSRAHEITINFEGRKAVYSQELLKELELAYAVTVHKSQGNEFDAVVIPIFGGFEKLYYRQLLYTAVTRAKKMLIIVGSTKRVGDMVRNNKKMLRYTGLKYFLCEN